MLRRAVPRVPAVRRLRRPDAQCPRCGALERHRLLWLYLERATGLARGGLTVLHVAPEPVLSERLASIPGLRVVTIDLESPLARVRADLTRLPFRDRVFDVALCLHVLEHVLDDRAAMRELLRVLAPGGFGILQSPFDPARERTFEDASVTTPAERERVFGQRDHVRIYGRDYTARLREAGFEVEEIDYGRSLRPDEIRRFGLDAAETITRGARPPD